MMTEMFKIMVAGEVMAVMPIRTQENVVAFRSHSKCGACGQENTDLVLAGELEVVSVPFRSMLVRFQRRTVFDCSHILWLRA